MNKMADMDTYLSAILTAVYGEEVRGSIHDALEHFNNKLIAHESAISTFESKWEEGACIDLAAEHAVTEGTSNGLTWSNEAGGGVSVTGTATSYTNRGVLGSSSTIPDGFEAGKPYFVDHENDSVGFQVLVYTGNDTSSPYQSMIFWKPGAFALPSNLSGLRFMYYVMTDTTVNAVLNAKVYPIQAVVDAIGSKMDTMQDPLLSKKNIEWILGTINSSSGSSTAATNRIRSLGYIPITDTLRVRILDEEVMVAPRFYSSEATTGFIYTPGSIFWSHGDISVADYVQEHVCPSLDTPLYVRFVASYTDERVVSDVDAMAACFEILESEEDISKRVLDLEDTINTSTIGKRSYVFNPRFVVGDISTEDGSTTSTGSGIRTAFPVYASVISKVILDSADYEANCFFYNGAAYLGALSAADTGTLISGSLPYSTADGVAIVITKADGTAIGAAGLEEATRHIHVYTSIKLTEVKLDLEYGKRNTVNAQYAEGDLTTCRHAQIVQIPNEAYIQFDPDNVYVTYRGFDKHKLNLEVISTWIDTPGVIIPDEDIKYIYLIFEKPDDTEITSVELTELPEYISIQVTGNITEDKYQLVTTVPVLKTPIGGELPIAPTLCAVKYKHTENQVPTPIGWLYRDNATPFSFYWSSDGYNLEQIFQWNTNITNYQPIDYCFTVSAEGDIIAVFRGERQYYLGNREASDLRKSPIVYPHGDYSNPVMVDFGSDDPPTSWLENTGVHCESGAVYMAEYTRFAHTKAYVWKVTAPYYNKSDWAVKKTFTVSGVQTGFKHCHNIERDPFAGVLWLTTGDVPPTDPNIVGTPGIYYSLDNGATWTTLYEGSEKYCRQLNFIWTKDYVYWSSDTSSVSQHYFIRAPRDANGIIDMSRVEDLWHFFQPSASYNICYCEDPHGILILERYDSLHYCPLDVYFWDLDEQKMYVIDRFKPSGTSGGYTGFRVEAMNHYASPRSGGYLCGFSCFYNFIDRFGNKENDHPLSIGYTQDDTDNIGAINNLELRVVRK